MTNFCFIDTNIIIGYCNQFDYLHEVAIDFFKDKRKKNIPIFLLFSVQEEFYSKIQKEAENFISLLKPELHYVISDLDDLKSKNPILEYNKFFKFIINLLQDKKLENISFSDAQLCFLEVIQKLRKRFDELVGNWIKRPFKKQYVTVLNDDIYKYYYNKLDNIGNKIHKPDTIHLALASYEVRKRNIKRKDHQYTFYTDDKNWINYDLESVIRIPNFKIKRITYREDTKLEFDQKTQSFSRKKIIKRIYIPDNL